MLNDESFKLHSFKASSKITAHIPCTPKFLFYNDLLIDSTNVRIGIAILLIVLYILLGRFWFVVLLKLFFIVNVFLIHIVELSEASKLYRASCIIKAPAEEIREELFSGKNL